MTGVWNVVGAYEVGDGQDYECSDQARLSAFAQAGSFRPSITTNPLGVRYAVLFLSPHVEIRIRNVNTGEEEIVR